MPVFEEISFAIASALAVLSALGMTAILAFLWKTESAAPSILESIREGGYSSLDAPLVSVIITARNEERVIARCISSIQHQTYVNTEIIVVDDASTDRTLEIARMLSSEDKRIRVFEAGVKPLGWIGKSWPCQEGFRASNGTVLLFVDADSTFSVKTLELCLNRLEDEKIDVYSISPKVELEGVWSHAVMPLLAGAINLLYPMAKVNDPSSERAYVFGTFILIRRAAYEKIGGHESVRDTLVEDAALGKRAKMLRFKLRVERGGDLISTEWESGLEPIYHGLERIFSDSMRSFGRLSILNSVGLFFLGLYPIFFIVTFLILLISSALGFGFDAALVGLAGSIISIAVGFTLAVFELRDASKTIAAYPLLYPLGFALFIAAVLSTAWKLYFLKPLEWKGQQYSLAPRVDARTSAQRQH